VSTSINPVSFHSTLFSFGEKLLVSKVLVRQCFGFRIIATDRIIQEKERMVNEEWKSESHINKLIIAGNISRECKTELRDLLDDVKSGQYSAKFVEEGNGNTDW
jgi:hypothetical protein